MFNVTFHNKPENIHTYFMYEFQFLCKGISKAIRIHASLAELMHVFK